MDHIVPIKVLEMPVGEHYPILATTVGRFQAKSFPVDPADQPNFHACISVINLACHFPSLVADFAEIAWRTLRLASLVGFTHHTRRLGEQNPRVLQPI